MLSLKRLIYVLLIVVGLSSIFLFYNINEINTQTVTIHNKIIEDKPLEKGKIEKNLEETIFYVVGDPDKEIYGDVFRNVCSMMEDKKLPWEMRSLIEPNNLIRKNSVIIFCDDIVNTYVNQEELGNFIEEGGKVVFAAGLAQGYEDSYLLPVIGITEKTIRTNYNDYFFPKEFFPIQEDQMSYNGYTMSTWINVRSEADVYVEDLEKQVPLIYTYPYGEGESLIINATFLSDLRCIGFLSSGLAVLLDEFVYPILGLECLYLDNFPVVTYDNDSVSMRLYGRTTEAFVRDVVWPVFQGMALRNEVKYTSSILSVTSEEDSFPEISDSLFGTMGKSALQYNGELAYASLCLDEKKLYKNDKFFMDFDETFRNYTISSLVMMSDVGIKSSVDLLDRDISVVRGNLRTKNPGERFSAKGSYYIFPNATSGIDLDNGSLLNIASVYSAYGMISHTFDINDFVEMDEGKPGWDRDKILLADFEERILKVFDNLEKTTLSETKNHLKSYEKLKYTWKNKEDSIVIMAENYIPGQSFMVRTKGRITRAEGAEYEEIGNSYYMVRLTSSKAMLEILRGE